MVTYKQLSAFVGVAQSSTFAEAAEKVHLSQPALSSAIKTLEAQLGGKLFSRSTRKVSLSPEGREFLPTAIRLIRDWDDAITDIQNLFAMHRGKLTLAAMPSFASSLLPQILSTFHRQWQHINISVMDVVMEQVIQNIRQGRAEIGFTFETDNLEGLEFKPIVQNRFIAVMPPDHRLAQAASVSWQQLSDNRFVAMNRGSTLRQWIEHHTRSQDIELNIVAEANQLATLGEFVKQGMGVSVVPGVCQRQFTSNGLRCLEIAKGDLHKWIGMIRSSRTALSMPAQALWQQVSLQRF